MNNRKERLKYFKNIKSDYPFGLCEEVFIASVAKNDYAMNYVKKQYEALGDDILRADYSSVISDYHIRTLMVKSLDSIPSLKLVFRYILYIEKTNKLDLLEALIKKSFSKLYKNLKNGFYKIDTSKIDECCVALFILSFLDIDTSSINRDILDILTNSAAIVFQGMSLPVANDISILKEPMFKNIVEKYKLDKSTSIKKMNGVVYDEFSYDFISFLTKKGFSIEESKTILFDSIDNKSKLKDSFLSTEIESVEIYKHHNFIINTLDEYTLAYSQVIEQELKTKDVAIILQLLKTFVNDKTITEKELEKYFIISVNIYAIANILNQNIITISTLFLTNNTMESFFTVQKDILQEEIYLLRAEQEEKTLSLKNKDSEIERLNRELEKARAQVNALNKKLSKVDDNKEELNNLRELFFSLEKNDDIIDLRENNSFEIDSSLKIAFIGGSDVLRSRLKEEFADFTYISPDDLTKDLSFTRNMDYIFIHTHMSHSMYYKIIDAIRFNKINFSFLNDVNIDLLKANILNKLEKTFK